MVLTAPKDYTANEDADVVAAAGGATVEQWKSLVLAGNEAFYAMPLNAPNILRIDASSGSVKALSLSPPLSASSMSYSAALLGPDGAVYGVPFSASKVVRVDPTTDAVATFGALGSGMFKWSHGVLATTGHIYCLPAFASQVMQIDPYSGSATLMAGILEPQISTSSRWIWGVLAPNGELSFRSGRLLSILVIKMGR
jgi:hypothetical protein